MAESYLSIVPFAEATFTRSVRMVHQAFEGLKPDDIYWMPTPETNSMGWLAWHLTRRKDYYSSKLVGDEQTWQRDRWHERMGMTAEETGTGHAMEEVRDFHPDIELLIGYVEATNADAIARLGKVDESTMEDEVELDAGRGMRPRHNIWNPMLSDCLQHTGQIAYVRGMITGKGWFDV
jgi:hypothetical protein